MSKVYLVKSGSAAEPMGRIMCKDETKELQDLLESNHDLLPGDQINPDEPRRWLLLKREMPVPDLGTGEHRWSIDFLFVDQGGIPTFVECKRFQDTRSRREVIGQMLEYAANGQYYWTKEALLEYLTKQSASGDSNLEEAVRSFEPETGDSIEDFFELIENNLREGQLRIVFFLEEAPNELKSIVDFLNRQMERSEVLIVEAKQYEKDGLRVLVPSLFGYTEQARRVKKTVTVLPSGRRKWNEVDFFKDAQERLDSHELDVLRNLLDFVKSNNFQIRWGTGKQTGSFSVIDSRLFNKSIIGVCSDGRLFLNFGSFTSDERMERFRDEFAQRVSGDLGLSLPHDLAKKYPSFSIKEWAPKVGDLTEILNSLPDKYSKIDV